MMYHEKLATAIRVNGQVLKEFKDTVYVPYGSEYEIRIKNLNTVRALVKISIDGKDVTEAGLVIGPGQTIDLERSIANGNLEKGNKFKFIERTAQIEDHRGIELEDGLVSITYQYEKPRPVVVRVPVIHEYYPRYPRYYDWHNWPHDRIFTSCSTGGGTYAYNNIARSAASNSAGDAGTLSQFSETTHDSNEVGITVPGSVSEQKFQTVDNFEVEEATFSMVLKLLGQTATKTAVKEAVTVRAKPKCTTCGHLNRVTNKFCSSCGTGLEIV